MKELRKLTLEELFKLRDYIQAELNELGTKLNSEQSELDIVQTEIERRQDINVSHN